VVVVMADSDISDIINIEEKLEHDLTGLD
jgi:hypothetical protein